MSAPEAGRLSAAGQRLADDMADARTLGLLFDPAATRTLVLNRPEAGYAADEAGIRLAVEVANRSVQERQMVQHGGSQPITPSDAAPEGPSGQTFNLDQAAASVLTLAREYGLESGANRDFEKVIGLDTESTETRRAAAERWAGVNGTDIQLDQSVSDTRVLAAVRLANEMATPLRTPAATTLDGLDPEAAALNAEVQAHLREHPDALWAGAFAAITKSATPTPEQIPSRREVCDRVLSEAGGQRRSPRSGGREPPVRPRGPSARPRGGPRLPRRPRVDRA